MMCLKTNKRITIDPLQGTGVVWVEDDVLFYVVPCKI